MQVRNGKDTTYLFVAGESHDAVDIHHVAASSLLLNETHIL
jgi:hypothetical protein